MDLITYKQHLATLIKSPTEILESLNPYKVNLLHMVVGLAGELAELAAAHDTDNYLEEFGDSGFYLTGLKMALDEYPAWCSAQGPHVSLTHVDSFGFNHYCYPYTEKVHWKSQCVIVGGEILDMVKKHCIYNKDIDASWCYTMAQHIHALEHKLDFNAVSCEGWHKEDVRAANIAKLAKPYPQLGYTDKAAQEWIDKQTNEQQWDAVLDPEPSQGNPQRIPLEEDMNVQNYPLEDRRLPAEVPVRARGKASDVHKPDALIPDDVQ